MSSFAGLDLKGAADDRGRWLLHGPQGSGKTTLASTLAEVGPTLLVDLIGERGTRVIKGSPYEKNIKIVRPTSVTQLDDIFWALDKGDHPFKVVILDSLTALQKMAMRYLMGHDETAVREIQQGTAPAQIQTWGQALDIMTDTATFWYGLADEEHESPMHVVLISQTREEQNAELGVFSRDIDVQRGARGIMKAAPDYVLFTDLEEDMEADSEDGPVYRHIVRFGSNPDYRLKARIPHNLRGKLPSIIGRKQAPNLTTLSRVLGVGGIPPRKKDAAKKTTTARKGEK